jgi:iron complex outermembrane receptor protein
MDCAAIATVASIARTTIDVGVSYDFPPQDYGQFSARMDYSHRAHTDWDTFNLPDTPFKNSIYGAPYGLLSARLTLSDIPIAGKTRAQIALFGQNLTDEHFNAQGIDFQLFGTVTYGERRTFGVEGKIDF